MLTLHKVKRHPELYLIWLYRKSVPTGHIAEVPITWEEETN